MGGQHQVESRISEINVYTTRATNQEQR
jgi:hypothetical protein